MVRGRGSCYLNDALSALPGDESGAFRSTRAEFVAQQPYKKQLWDFYLDCRKLLTQVGGSGWAGQGAHAVEAALECSAPCVSHNPRPLFNRSQGYTGHMIKVGDFRYSYFIWFETGGGARLVLLMRMSMIGKCVTPGARLTSLSYVRRH